MGERRHPELGDRVSRNLDRATELGSVRTIRRVRGVSPWRSDEDEEEETKVNIRKAIRSVMKGETARKAVKECLSEGTRIDEGGWTPNNFSKVWPLERTLSKSEAQKIIKSYPLSPVHRRGETPDYRSKDGQLQVVLDDRTWLVWASAKAQSKIDQILGG